MNRWEKSIPDVSLASSLEQISNVDEDLVVEGNLAYAAISFRATEAEWKNIRILFEMHISGLLTSGSHSELENLWGIGQEFICFCKLV